MPQSTQKLFRDHLIESEHYFDDDIRKWHVRCSITDPAGLDLGTKACPDPMHVANEAEAIERSLAYGVKLVTAGLVW